MTQRSLQRTFRVQWVLLLAALAAVAGVLAYTQLRMRTSTLADESVRLQTLTRVADQVLAVQVASADAALRTMRDDLDRWRSGDAYAPFAMEHLKRVEKMMPGVRTFVVLNAQGLCQLSNRPELVGQSFSQRDYFVEAVAAVARGENVLTVSPPYRTALGVWAVTVSRAVVSQTGVVTGVVAATLSPDYFQALMNNMGHAPDMRISLVHDTGRLYVSAPVSEPLMDTDFLQPGTFTKRHLDSGQPENVFADVTVVQGSGPRLAALRSVSLKGLGAHEGFIAVAARDMDALLADWRHDNAVMASALLVMVVLSAASLLLYQRWAERLAHRAQRVEAELEVSHARYEQLANTLPCVLFDFAQDAAGRLAVHFVSPYAQHLLGLSAEGLTADPRLVLQHMPAEDAVALRQHHERAHRLQQPYACTVRLQQPGGQMVWVQVSASPSAVAGQPGATLWSGFAFDVTDRMQLETDLRHMAFHDPLTGAHNRRSFMLTLTQEVHRVQRTGDVAALLMLDIDHFKRVNDTFGHDAGDDVLKHLVGVLQAALRRPDTLARLGGEEFAVLLPATQLPGALELAERLRVAVETTPATLRDQPGQTVVYTISIGVALLGPHAPSADDVLKRADRAMYQAKSTGRNRVCAEPLSSSDPLLPPTALPT